MTATATASMPEDPSAPTERLIDAPHDPNAMAGQVSVANRDLVRWQNRLLPFMTRFIVFVSVAFFALSIVNLVQINGFVRGEHEGDIRGQIEKIAPEAKARNVDEMTQQTLLILEADLVDKRYHQASALLMSRIWTRQLAFMTGMILAFLGAVFILGKMSEPPANVSGEGAGWKLGITSTSPGLILSFFGTVLLVVSLFVQTTIDVRDGSVYVPSKASGAQNSTTSIHEKPTSSDQDTSPLTEEDLHPVPETPKVPKTK
ncbi:MAG TPA: hypothetical protein VGK21_14025 [Candidatus Angelobacter sp.]|jgi:hypothetical protein